MKGKMLKRVISLSLAVAMSLIPALTPLGDVFGLNMEVKADGETVFNVTDYGADPAGGVDSSPGVRAAIEAARAFQEENPDTPIRINFPEGRYDFYPDKVKGETFYVSNTLKWDATTNELNQAQGSWDGNNENTNAAMRDKYIGILIDELNHVTVDGNGSTFMYHGNMTPFGTFLSENVRFQNFKTDFQTPWTVDTTIVEVNRSANTFTIKIPECYGYSVSGTNITVYSEKSPYDGQYYFQRNSAAVGNAQIRVLDMNDNKWINQNNHNYLSGATTVTNNGDSTFTIYKSGGLPNWYRPGIVFQSRDTTRRTPVTFIYRSSNVDLLDIDYGYCHGFGLVAQHSMDLSFTNLKFAPDKTSGRTSGGFADFMQISGCGGKVLVDGCVFRNPQDDPINIHGTYNAVQSIGGTNRNQVTVRFTHGETLGFLNYSVGDEIEFCANDSAPYDTSGNLASDFQNVFTAKVVAYDGPDGRGNIIHMDASGETITEENVVNNQDKLRNITLTLDKSIPGSIPGSNIRVENLTYIPEIEVKNCTFEEAGPRGILIKARNGIKIHDNLFDGVQSYNIEVENPGAGWMESGRVDGLDIYNNVFKRSMGNNGDPIVLVEASARVHQNIKVYNNVFYMGNWEANTGDSKYKAVQINRTKGVKIYDNKVQWLDPNINLSFNNAGETKQTHTLNLGESMSIGTQSGSSPYVSVSGKSGSVNIFQLSNCSNEEIYGNTYDDGIDARVTGASGDLNIHDDELLNNQSNQRTVGRNLYFTSDNPNVVEVSADGTLYAKAVGTANIRVYAISADKKYEASNTLEVTVNNASAQSASGINVTASGNKAGDAGTITFTPAVTMSSGTYNDNVTWAVKNAENDSTSTAMTLNKSTAGAAEAVTGTAVGNGVVLVEAKTNNNRTATKIAAMQVGGKGLADNFQYYNNNNRGVVLHQDGSVDLQIKQGDIWTQSNPGSMIYIPVSKIPGGIDFRNENWRLEVTLEGSISGEWFQAGMLLYKDLIHFINVQRQQRNNNLTYIARVSRNGSGEGPREEAVPSASQIATNQVGSELTLILEKESNNVYAKFIRNGTESSRMSSSNYNFSQVFGDSGDLYLGLFTCGNNNTENSYRFRDLKVSRLNAQEKTPVDISKQLHPTGKPDSVSLAFDDEANPTKLTTTITGDAEKDSVIIRYAISDTDTKDSNGAPENYSIISGQRGETFKLNNPAYIGKYITACAVFIKENLPGDIVWSESKQITKISEGGGYKNANAYLKTATVKVGGNDITGSLQRGSNFTDGSGFSKKIYAYNYKTNANTTSLEYLFETEDPEAKINVDYQNDGKSLAEYYGADNRGTSGPASGTKTLKNAANMLEVTVTAADGITQRVYRFNIYRMGDNNKGVSIQVDGQNVDLSNKQEINGINYVDYALPNQNAQSATITARADSGFANVKISTLLPDKVKKTLLGNGTGSASGNVDSIIPGEHPITIVVAPETNACPAIYVLNLRTRDVSDARLSNFTLTADASDAYLNYEHFNKDTNSYKGYISRPGVELAFTAMDSEATVEVYLEDELKTPTPVTASGNVHLKLKVGDNNIRIVVTSANGSSTETYNIKIEGHDYVYLTDLFPEVSNATVSGNYSGYPYWDKSNNSTPMGTVDAATGQALTYTGAPFGKGITVHPKDTNVESTVQFNISGRGFTRFEASVGVAPSAMNSGTEEPNLKFQVKVNNSYVNVTESGNSVESKLHANNRTSSGPQNISVALNESSNTITLCTSKGTGKSNNSSQHGAWVAPRLYRDFEIVDREPPVGPTNLQVSNLDEGKAVLTYTNATDNDSVKGYRLTLKAEGNDSPIVELTEEELKVLSYEFTGLTHNQSYVITIIAVDDTGNEGTPVTETFTYVDESLSRHDVMSIHVSESDIGVKNGALEADIRTALSKVAAGIKIRSAQDSDYIPAHINWNTIPSYDPESTGAQTITVTGVVELPTSPVKVTNSENRSLEVSVTVHIAADTDLEAVDATLTGDHVKEVSGVYHLEFEHGTTLEDILKELPTEATLTNGSGDEKTVSITWSNWESNPVGTINNINNPYNSSNPSHFEDVIKSDSFELDESWGWTNDSNFPQYALVKIHVLGDLTYDTWRAFSGSDEIEIPHGTTSSDLMEMLPKQVVLVSRGNVTEEVTVTWNDVVTSGYDISKTEAYSFTVAGTIGRASVITGAPENISVRINVREFMAPEPEIIKYWVTFNSVAGSNVPGVEYEENSLIVEPATPVKSGYNFGGWYKDAFYKEKWDFNSDVITSNMELYAMWIPVTYPVIPPTPIIPWRPSTNTNTNANTSPEPAKTESPVISNEQAGTKAEVSATKTGGSAKVTEISSEVLEVVTTDRGDVAKTIELDVSTGKSGAEAIKAVALVKTEAVEIAKVLSDTTKMEDSITLKTDGVTIKIDASALTKVTEEALGNEIQVVIDNVIEANLDNAAKLAVESINSQVGKQVEQTFEAYIVSGGKRISDFGSGTITVGKLDFKIPAGKNPKNYHVYYLDDKGNAIKHPSWYENGVIYFNTNHFSEYAVVYDENEENGKGDLVFKLFNKNSGEVLLTTDATEINYLLNTKGWENQGTLGRSLASGVAVYRVFNPKSGEHLYTADRNEVRVLTGSKGWNLEYGGKPMYYANGTYSEENSATVAVYRGFKANILPAASHRYEVEKAGKTSLTDAGYVLDNKGNAVYYLGK